MVYNTGWERVAEKVADIYIRGKSGLSKDRICWITPSVREYEDSATEKYRPTRVRVQRCGKSAPATSRGVGSVNPDREQGGGMTVGLFPIPL
jgi:hypothetical protein